MIPLLLIISMALSSTSYSWWIWLLAILCNLSITYKGRKLT